MEWGGEEGLEKEVARGLRKEDEETKSWGWDDMAGTRMEMDNQSGRKEGGEKKRGGSIKQ